MDKIDKQIMEQNRNLNFCIQANDIFLDILGLGLLDKNPEMKKRVEELLYSKPDLVKK